MRKISTNSISVNGSVFHYSVVVRDMFNCDGVICGELYGAHISGSDDHAEALDLTTHKDKIFDFVKKLCECSVTPVALRDVVFDSLPL